MTVLLGGMRLDEEPSAPVQAVLALGVNLGDREATLQSALDALAAYEGLHLEAVSPVFETSPVGGPDQPDYLNAVALARTRLSPLALLAACQEVEAEHGRARIVRWGPRTLDVDIVTYGEIVASTPVLTLPHPRAAERAFVLVPWALLEPDAVLPGSRRRAKVRKLAAKAADAPGLRLREDVVLQVRG